MDVKEWNLMDIFRNKLSIITINKTMEQYQKKLKEENGYVVLK